MLQAIHVAEGSLMNFQTLVDVLGDNLANLNTTGFKGRRVAFRDLPPLLAAPPQVGADGLAATPPDQIGIGAVIGSIQRTTTEGTLQATGVATDTAIDGNGFFVVQSGTKQLLTRDGSFTQDAAGNLQLTTGGVTYGVMGYGAQNGVVNTGALAPINIPVGLLRAAQATGTVAVQGNLNAASAIYNPGPPESGGVARVNVTIDDSLGATHQLNLTLKNLGARVWSWEAALGTGDADTLTHNAGAVTFGADGKPTTASDFVTINSTAGAASPQNVTLSWANLTLLTAASSVTATNTDGFAPGTLQSFTTDVNGVITGAFSSGLTRVLGQFALGNVPNPSALTPLGNSLLQLGPDAGSLTVGTPNAGGLGQIRSSTLELSNVTLSDQFAQLVVAQRAFQSSSRVLRAADEMWQSLINLRG